MNEISEIQEADGVSPANPKLHIANILKLVRARESHGLKNNLRFIVAAVIHHEAFLKLTRHDADAAFERLIADRPQYVSLLTAPYIDARWSSSKRVDRLMDHVSALRGRLGKYDFSISQSLNLLDLGQLSIPDYHIIIDKPMWFCHEGLLTLNLFKGNFRFYSVTFSFCSVDSDLGIIVGGIQGRRTKDILARYREFTKLAYGLRPRDFIFEVLRIIARAENVKHIFGIPDRFRYHRHTYFARNKRQELYLDYDEIWKDRGGVLTEDGMYDIPLTAERRLSRVVAKKRSMYRRRYNMLVRLETKILSQLETVVPIASDKAD